MVLSMHWCEKIKTCILQSGLTISSAISSFLPVLLFNHQPVRKGTNGGVTKAGLLAAAAAGSVLGLIFVILGFITTSCTFNVAMKQLLLIPISALSGLCGSIIDSLLGATLQYSGFCSVRNKVIFHISEHQLNVFIIDWGAIFLGDRLAW